MIWVLKPHIPPMHVQLSITLIHTSKVFFSSLAVHFSRQLMSTEFIDTSVLVTIVLHVLGDCTCLISETHTHAV